MKANDGDKDRQHNIVYFLTGQGVDPDQPDQSMFDINSTTGEIFVLKVSQVQQSCLYKSELYNHSGCSIWSDTWVGLTWNWMFHHVA